MHGCCRYPYWQIGREILSRQDRERWGAKVIDRLAADLKRSFPDMRGFTQKSQIHARFRRSLGGGVICASGACTNHFHRRNLIWHSNTKDPYKFDFLMLGTDYQERDLERAPRTSEQFLILLSKAHIFWARYMGVWQRFW